jgi:hypothetical protein
MNPAVGPIHEVHPRHRQLIRSDFWPHLRRQNDKVGLGYPSGTGTRWPRLPVPGTGTGHSPT